MSDENDNDLRGCFAQQRRRDHENAPAWRPEALVRPATRPRVAVRWVPTALATACVIALALFFAGSPRRAPELSDLPPLLDSPPGELFAGLRPSFTPFEAPSDFLLPTQHLP